MSAAREAVPLLRDEGMLFWFFDHMALRSALGGRTKDAVLICGYADARYRETGHPREPIAREAVNRLEVLSFPKREFEQSARVGAQLSEAQIVNLALRG
ncbi:MAG TPA: hypothetical protein VIY09_04265 [Rhizomicrobium sp.]